MRSPAIAVLALSAALLPASAAGAATFSPQAAHAPTAVQAGQSMAKTPVSTEVTVVKNSSWVRWLPNAQPAVGYITLANSGDRDLEVTRIISPDYKKISIYKTVTDSEASNMVKIDKFTIPAHGEFAMVPGKYHLTLEKPARLITPGDNARVIFFLSDGKVVKTKMPVRTSPELY